MNMPCHGIHHALDVCKRYHVQSVHLPWGSSMIITQRRRSTWHAWNLLGNGTRYEHYWFDVVSGQSPVSQCHKNSYTSFAGHYGMDYARQQYIISWCSGRHSISRILALKKRFGGANGVVIRRTRDSEESGRRFSNWCFSSATHCNHRGMRYGWLITSRLPERMQAENKNVH